MDRHLLERAGCRLESWRRTMILSHDRPDGDALGAMGAMKRVIEAAGRRAAAFVYDEVPLRYRFLESKCGFTRWRGQEPAAVDSQFDGVLILDTCSWTQLEPVAEYLRAGSRPKIVVDHHATGDDLSGPRADDLYLTDKSAASVCGMIHDWCEVMEWAIDDPTGELLFTGLATDTGWFRFSNTDGRTLRAAAELVQRGVRPDVMYSRFYASHSPARLRLMAGMLATMELHAGDAVAVMCLPRAMFDRSGATTTDTEDLVNEALQIGPVVVAVLLSELDDGRIRVNFRSKSPEVCGRDVDVAALAGQFGGGGHRRAAGARVRGSLGQVRERVTSALIAAAQA